MKIDLARMLGIVAVAGVVVVGGCCQKSESEPTKTAGVAERTGAAVDKAAEKTAEAVNTAVEKTGEAVKKTAAATKDAAGQAIEKTGAAVEKTGANMQE